jgi:hypothetical protein
MELPLVHVEVERGRPSRMPSDAVVFFTSSPTSARTVPGAGFAMYYDRLDVAGLPAAFRQPSPCKSIDVFDDDKTRIPRLPVLQSDRALRTYRSHWRPRWLPGAKCAAPAVSIFGRSLGEVNGFPGLAAQTYFSSDVSRQRRTRSGDVEFRPARGRVATSPLAVSPRRL